jgi:hypothetical protein
MLCRGYIHPPKGAVYGRKLRSTLLLIPAFDNHYSTIYGKYNEKNYFFKEIF